MIKNKKKMIRKKTVKKSVKLSKSKNKTRINNTIHNNNTTHNNNTIHNNNTTHNNNNNNNRYETLQSKKKNNSISRQSHYIKSSKKSIAHIKDEDSSILDLISKKSFTGVSSKSSMKSESYIGEIYNYKPLQNKINAYCKTKILKQDPTITKSVQNKLCNCLFLKNKDLTVEELEEKIKNKLQTPSTHCIKIYDDYKHKPNRKHK